MVPFLNVRRVAEPSLGRVARGIGAQTTFRETRRPHLEVQANLFLQVRGVPVAPQEIEQASCEYTWRHDRHQTVRRMREIAMDTRS
jgi:hypothetical protein